jgi:N-acetylglucosaminyldiphosphoundecaprenol N-acetyl-beta-D-mannosaminyltransferase
MASFPSTVNVLGLGLAETDYGNAVQALEHLHRQGKARAVAACNTHIVALARLRPDFKQALEKFDVLLPDGMPLVWAMRQKGADLKDRVYGPYFMQEAIRHLPRPWKHFFFGGTEACLRQLSEACRQIQPKVDIVGTFSPPFRAWTEKDEKDFAEIIRKSGADFIWVALGGDRQERWIAKNLPRHEQGVFLAVGDAFELLAGRRAFAPAWMQKAGLTWLYRLLQEPRRLLPRYLKFNSLFLFYTLRDRWLGPPAKGKRRIAFLGIRGIPGRYSGFETFVEELGPRLVKRGWQVTVYCRSHLYPERPSEFQGMKLVYLPAIRTKSLETITHTLLSCGHAIAHRFELVYLCGVGNALASWLLHLGGSRVVINVDGDDFRRPKWHWFARWWLRKSERWATRLADRVIADNTAIQKRYRQTYNFTPDLIGYGSPLAERPQSAETLERLGLRDRNYILCVGRISPENRVDLLVRAHQRSGVKTPLVIVGSYGYETRYYEECQRAAARNAIFAGAIYGDGYRELSLHAKMFVLPAAIEATRVVLVDQLGFGAAIVFQDCPASREVLGEAGEPFAPENPEESLAAALQKLDANGGRLEKLRAGALARAQGCYSWDAVADQYETLFQQILPAARTA